MGVFAEVFALGYCVSNDLVQFTPGVWTPEGWYPLALPMERLFVQLGWKSAQDSSVRAMFAAMAVSGVAAGLLALVLRSFALRFIFGNNITDEHARP